MASSIDSLKYSNVLALRVLIEIKKFINTMNTMEKLIIGILIVYGISVGIFGLYYNYLYAVENGFLAWLFFGEIVASFKALIWPLFEFKII